MGIKDSKIILVSLYLMISTCTAVHREIKVHEELDEHPPEYVRTARHLSGSEKAYQPPLFNYRSTVQHDRLKSKYNHQQRADFKNLKIVPSSSQVIFGLQQYLGQNRGTPMSIPFEETESDWKPFQPKFLNYNRQSHINQKKKLSESVKYKGLVSQDLHENDLDIAGSETEEQTIDNHRDDQQSKYIYVTPDVLKNDFGLDSKTTQEILQNSAPETVETNSDKFQISELQGLLGKNPSFQLQGLQKLLEDSKPIMENNSLPLSHQKEIPAIQIEHNGSPLLPSNIPELETLQQQINAVNKAQEQRVLAEAQKQAEAHLQAQHHAIALAQKQAQEEALAKIAAYNQGISTLSSSDVINQVTAAPVQIQNHQVSAPESLSDTKLQDADQNSLAQDDHNEVAALQGRPLEQVLVHPEEYGESYGSSTSDLRKFKPRIQGARARFYRPVSLITPNSETSNAPSLYNSKDVQNYSPVSPYTPHSGLQNDAAGPEIISVSAKSPLVEVPILQEHSQEPYQQTHLESSLSNERELYSEDQHTQQDDDVHQYAAKYAFGYRILDEKHGNDYGHEEERNGRLTKGHYYVTLPDGRKQSVQYYADNSGYHARVSYENVARHPYVPREDTEHDVNQLQSIQK